jgi:hypothetical protein
VLEVFGLQQLIPKALPVQANGLSFDSRTADLDRNDFDGLRQVRPSECRPFLQSS